GRSDAPRQGLAAEPAGSAEVRKLTRALRKQQEHFTACFAKHKQAIKSLPPIQLEFKLETDGQKSAVRVMPASVANTELGRCLHEAASATQFPPQTKPISFAVPLSASVN
ncbi:MAG TPA: hypothetical protein VFZ61_17860, partial [Polyangiales bacterium]